MPIVIVSDFANPEPWINALKKAAPTVEVTTHRQLNDFSGVEFALAWNHPPGIFMQFPSLKTISSLGAGVDHLLNDPQIPAHINIVRIIDPLLSNDMFEFALAIAMNRLRLLTHFRENQKQKIWKRQRYLRIADVTIGVLGTGVIGNHVAENLARVGFSVSGWSRTPGVPKLYPKYSGMAELPDFLKSSDILICLLPLTPETRGILNEKTLSMLRQGAWIVNLGRGGLLVDDDLISLLNNGHLEGANLDVFHNEPLPGYHPFWTHQKVFITPHIASLTDPESVSMQIVENYYRTLQNRPPLNQVDRQKGY